MTQKINVAKYEKILNAFGDGVFKYHDGRVCRMKRINSHKKLVDLPEEEVASHSTKRGYRRVTFNKTTVYEHTLIYALFNGIQKLYEIECVDHINAIKDDNRPENLEGVSIAENNRRAEVLNLVGRTYGTVNGMCKLSPEDIAEIKRLRESGRNQYEIAENMGVSQSHISTILSGKKRKFA